MTTFDAPLPTFFVSHGGGPWPWMKDQLPYDVSGMERSLQAIPGLLPGTPRAVVVVTAHWETPVFTVQTAVAPPMLHDYWGFPPHTYGVTYPAPGSPEVAHRVVALLRHAGIDVAEDDERGFDHGTFVPMAVAWPAADVAVVQLSVRLDHDPAAHLAAGRALAPLRHEGVLVLGSGFTYHNLRRLGPEAREPSRAFDTWLTNAVVHSTPAERTAALLRWHTAPSAREAHPVEEHLVPLMVAVGAAEQEPGHVLWHDDLFMGSVSASSYRFG